MTGVERRRNRSEAAALRASTACAAANQDAGRRSRSTNGVATALPNVMPERNITSMLVKA